MELVFNAARPNHQCDHHGEATIAWSQRRDRNVVTIPRRTGAPHPYSCAATAAKSHYLRSPLSGPRVCRSGSLGVTVP